MNQKSLCQKDLKFPKLEERWKETFYNASICMITSKLQSNPVEKHLWYSQLSLRRLRLSQVRWLIQGFEAILSVFKAYIYLSICCFRLVLDGLIQVYACEMVEVDKFRSWVKLRFRESFWKYRSILNECLRHVISVKQLSILFML